MDSNRVGLSAGLGKTQQRGYSDLPRCLDLGYASRKIFNAVRFVPGGMKESMFEMAAVKTDTALMDGLDSARHATFDECRSIVAEHCRCRICPPDGCSYVACFDGMNWVDMYEICLDVASHVSGKSMLDWDELLKCHERVRDSLKMAEAGRSSAGDGMKVDRR